MNTKKVLLVVILGLVTSAAFAQNGVKGQVVDGETLEGEPFATYSIFIKGEDSPIRMTITKEDGSFSENLKENGTYVIRFSSLGRKDVEKEFIAEGSPVDLGQIPMLNDDETLKSATVTALKPLVKMEVDKMTYKVEDDIDSKSMTMLDMLRKVPMVTVDAQDNITVNGSSSFKVYVDGKPNAMLSSNPSQIFKMMPASAFKSVEVITNPGAKYDAEGVGGVLNLITDKSTGQKAVQDGYNASLHLQADSQKSLGGGAMLTGQKGKFSFSANLGAMRQTMDGISAELSRQEVDGSGNVLSDLLSSATVDQTAPGVHGDFTASYEIDTLRLLTATAGIMDFRTRENQNSVMSMTTGGTVLDYDSRTDANYRFSTYRAGLDYQRSFAGKEGRMLTASYLLSTRPNATNSDNYFSIASIPDRRSLNNENMTEHTVQVDYTSPLREGRTLSTGLKFISRNNSSSSNYYLDSDGTWVLSPTESIDYQHLNSIIGAYGEYGFTEEKWSGKAGLRYEHTFQSVRYSSGAGSDFKLDYGNFVPSASIQYNLGMTSNIGLSYNLRISRPGIGYLNPYVDQTNYTSKSYGNTNLETEKSHNANLVFNFYTPVVMLNLTGRYSYCGNRINAYSFYDSEGILNTTYGNIVREQNAGVNAFINVNLGQKTRVYSNLGTSYVSLVSEERGLKNGGWNFNSFSGIQQTLPWDLRLSMNLILNSKNYQLDGYTSGFSAIMGGLSKTFFDDKLTVGFNAVAGLSKGGRLVFSSETRGSDYVSSMKTDIPLARVGINLSYSFGTAKNIRVRKAERTISNDDVLQKSSEATSTGSTALSGGSM